MHALPSARAGRAINRAGGVISFTNGGVIVSVRLGRVRCAERAAMQYDASAPPVFTCGRRNKIMAQGALGLGCRDKLHLRES